MKNTLFICLLFSCCLSGFAAICHANQVEYLDKLLESRKSENPPNSDAWSDLQVDSEYTPVYMSPQDGSMEADRIGELPGQPEVDFDQYSGYVTVDQKAGRALFYYFVESPEHSSTKPLVLWLNGGPGCSSLIGAMEELGPFRVNSDGKTLYRNPYAWNNVANVIFLESPAGVGFSYSNTSSDYDKCGDKNTAKDAYTFLVNWLERFPQYKTRDFFLTGESYSGHYVPQLAYTILRNNRNTNQTVINLKGIAIGNAYINAQDSRIGMLEYFWNHAMYSDEAHAGIQKYCYPHFTGEKCDKVLGTLDSQVGKIDVYNVYSPLCHSDRIDNGSQGLIYSFDPCTDSYVTKYMNLAEVQTAFHVYKTKWSMCSDLNWHDSPTTILPILKQLMSKGISVWIYSGDMDGRIPVTSTRYSVDSLKLPIKKSWYPWYTDKEVGGYAVEYQGLVFATVRGAGHLVPSYQPERALTMISSFLQGKLPPAA